MRRHDWAARMFDVVAAHEAVPFSWSGCHCCVFVARVVDAMTDSAHEAALLAVAFDEASSAALMEQHAGLAGAVSAFLGPPADARAKRGDIVLFQGGDGPAVAVCLGGAYVGMGPQGLQRVDRAAVQVDAVWVIP